MKLSNEQIINEAIKYYEDFDGTLEESLFKHLVEQAKRAERYEKALNELEIGFEDFGKVTGDKRFVYGIKQVKEKFNL